MDKLEYERKHLEDGKKYIAGVDEVGRGPLAGPAIYFFPSSKCFLSYISLSILV